MKIAPPAKGDIDDLRGRLTSCALSTDHAFPDLFCRGNNSSLVVSLQIDIGLNFADQEAIIESLSAQVRDAKVAFLYSRFAARTS